MTGYVTQWELQFILEEKILKYGIIFGHNKATQHF